MLSAGEMITLISENMQQFSVSSKEVISVHWQADGGKFLIKGLKQGVSDLIILGKNKQKKVRFYVVRKNRQLKFAQIKKSLSEIGLSAKVSGAYLQVSGEVKDLNDYLLFTKVAKDFKKYLILQVQISRQLRNQIIADVYELFFDHGYFDIRCENETYQIDCRYNDSLAPKKSHLDKFSKNFPINFIPIAGKLKSKNFLVKLYIYQMERMDGEELNLGLDRINTNLSALFSRGIEALVENNQLVFDRKNLHASTIAHPQTVLQLGKEAKIQMGSEIPFTFLTENRIENVNWKFAGLELKLNLKQAHQGLQLDYQVTVTSPMSNQSIQGSKNNSSIKIHPDQDMQIFQIDIKSIGKESHQMPWLSRIPILGKIFTSSNENNNYKRIIGHLRLEVMP